MMQAQVGDVLEMLARTLKMAHATEWKKCF